MSHFLNNIHAQIFIMYYYYKKKSVFYIKIAIIYFFLYFNTFKIVLTENKNNYC